MKGPVIIPEELKVAMQELIRQQEATTAAENEALRLASEEMHRNLSYISPEDLMEVIDYE